ncbi:hypothetical protein [Bordetella genomosp. 13]|uniref:hypothetical protein n=1 Tax=Bordetella genomosp. 13 TaxID=463040 RepID=UPI0011A021FE|nr:hypothetical protein [Bordetella genomosp. 13]
MPVHEQIDFSPTAARLLRELTSERVNQALERYAEILRRERAVRLLSESEWFALREALDDGGYDVAPASAIAGWLWRRWGAALDTGVAERWHIDGAGLLNRLRLLTYAQEVAVLEDLRALARKRS